MKSTEKVLGALEQMADADDGELREALPIPISPTALRMVIPAIIDRLPPSPEELDEFLTGVAGFCLNMRSDDYAPAV